MPTIVTHSYFCRDCQETTELHREDGVDIVEPRCEHCDSANLEKEA